MDQWRRHSVQRSRIADPPRLERRRTVGGRDQAERSQRGAAVAVVPARRPALPVLLGGGARSQFAWFDRNGRELATVGPPGDFLSPALSPDETHLAFTRRDLQPAGDIWTLDLSKETPLRFTFGAETHVYPVWTPDGS